MNASSGRRRSLLVDLTPLRQSPAFARLWAGSALAGIGAQVTVVAVGLHLYHLTQSTLAVSLVALWSLVPMIAAGLWGGMLADAFDRRRVALIAASCSWLSIAALTAITLLGNEVTWPLYLLTAINAASATILGTTRAAILPRLLPASLLPAAAALTGISTGLMVTVGPAIAGVLVALVGFGWTYLVDVVLFSAAFLGVATLPKIVPEGSAARPGLRSLAEGLRFLRAAPNVRATFVIDLIAMTFGTPRAVFPAVGALVIGGGPVTVGVLTAAYAIGALVCSLLSGGLGRVRWQGRAVLWSVAAYGASIALFGGVLLAQTVSRGAAGISAELASTPALIAAGVALALAGASDNVSAIFRTTILQTAVPDAMRGRLQGVFTVVVTGGPRLGDLYAGILATTIALWCPPLLGGLVIAALMLVLARVYRGFRGYDALDPRP